MNAKVHHGAQTSKNAPQTMREEMNHAMTSANGALDAVLRQAREIRATNLNVTRATIAKAKEDLARMLSSQRSMDVPTPETTKPPMADNSQIQSIFAEQMKLTQESIAAAQEGIDRAMAATSHLVDTSMQQAGATSKNNAGSSGTSTGEPRRATGSPRNTRVRRTFRRRR